MASTLKTVSSVSEEESVDYWKTPNRRSMVHGSTRLYGRHGQLIYIPMPTGDPKDPLNLPSWRITMALISIAIFDAFAITAESIIASLVPVFVLYYSGIDPKLLTQIRGLPPSSDGKVNPNPMDELAGIGGPPLYKIYFLSSMPLLTNGLATYILVPLSIAVGRRPVLILCGALSWCGGLWAAFSTDLDTHIAAMCLMGVGAGTIQAMIPMVVGDLVFIHQRNRIISAIWSFQAAVVVCFAIVSPHIIATLRWQWIYYLISGAIGISWVMMLLFMPETRWNRSSRELAGESLVPLAFGQDRPELDSARYGPRNYNSNFGLLVGDLDWRGAAETVLNTIRSFFFPNIFWMMLINSALVTVSNAMSQLASPVLLAKDWKFVNLGLGYLAIAVSTPFVWLISGVFADSVSNFLARRNRGRREPEMHLINLIFPLLIGILACFLYGIGGEYLGMHWMVFLVGIGMMAFSYLSVVAITSVYVIEAYPEWSGAVLTNVSAFRTIIGFAFSFRISDWVQQRGYLNSFIIYGAALAFVSLGLPFIYIYGKRIRAITTKMVKPMEQKDGARNRQRGSAGSFSSDPKTDLGRATPDSAVVEAERWRRKLGTDD